MLCFQQRNSCDPRVSGEFRYPVTIRYPVMIFFWPVSGELLSGSIRYSEKRYPAHPYYTAKKPQTCCKLSILPACCNLSTRCNKLVNLIKLPLSFADMLRLVETTCNKPVDNKFWQWTCNTSVVVNKLSQASNAFWYRLVDSLLQDVNRFVSICAFSLCMQAYSYYILQHELILIVCY